MKISTKVRYGLKALVYIAVKTGYIKRTPRGRMVTNKAKEHFEIKE